MPKSIKTLVHLSFVIVGLSLLVVIALGVRQYRLNNQYAEISALSERALFGFGTIRDQVTEAMLSSDADTLTAVIPDIELLSTQVSRIYDYAMIPAQYKLAIANNVDLSGLVIELRKLESAPDTASARLALQHDLRQIGENLIKVDRIITSHIRDSVISFQLTVIGTMGILISFASFILIMLYRRAVMPLLDLSAHVGRGDDKTLTQFDCAPEAGLEIQRFVGSVNELLARTRASELHGLQNGDTGQEQLAQTVNETVNTLNAMINYAQLLLESEPADLSAEQREMLSRIVESGERISGRWQEAGCGFDPQRKPGG